MKHIFYLISILSLFACDSYLDIEPVGQVIPKTVEDYRSFLTSAYAIKHNHKVLTAYRTDELVLDADASGVEQYQDLFVWNDINPSPITSPYPYPTFYKVIFNANHIINNKDEIEGEQLSINQLVAEAYALRALQYFELINLYAKPYKQNTAETDLAVPITLSYDAEKAYTKKSLAQVYDLILSDLDKATALMQIQQQDIGNNYRFSLWGVKAFQTKVYLYQQKWQKAITSATEALAIENKLQDLNSNTTDLPSVYNSVESILALENVGSVDLANNATISEDLLAVFQADEDLRFNLYFDEQSDGRFKSNKNADLKYRVSFRTSELYLTQIECLARLNQESQAKQLLKDFAKNRYTTAGWNAYQTKIDGLDTAELITEILEERRREFALEGHRWYDLRRTTQPAISKTFNGVTYQLEQNDERYVIPFPNEALINNPNL
ncbi:RagB/SusD family nutrient uptake outer membrane protein [Ochrovirga pacifica]|uniref:RagB/SusD family nutrient uptake outer membrane protein n=1 Tax=Ochrovirga pacifica TaxID=1042376 RepID=UPI0002557755|nr:RagB/SusD family nutrient uptake outer membrane protein [Ochrovirga pacifica]